MDITKTGTHCPHARVTQWKREEVINNAIDVRSVTDTSCSLQRVYTFVSTSAS